MTQVVLFGDGVQHYNRPLAIYTLASYLRQHNITVQPVWAWKHESHADFESICKKFLNRDVLVVGISTTLLKFPSKNFWGIPDDQFKMRIKRIKQLAPNAKIVVGGDQVTNTPVGLIPHKEYIDLFIQGQGEESLLAFVNAVLEGTRIQTTSVIPPVTGQTVYPYNNFSNSHTHFAEADCVVPGEALSLEFARGCIFKCSFCSYDLLGKKMGDYTKNGHALREELIRNYNEHGTVDYTVVDDLINDSEDKIDLILDVTQSLPFAISYTGYVRLDLLRRYPNTIHKLRDSGLVGAFFGVETINAASGKAVGKGLGRERIEEALALLHDGWQQNVCVELGMILGLPHDTEDTKNELLEWLSTPLVRSVVQNVSINALGIDPGRNSEIDTDPAKFGYTLIDAEHNWTTKNYSSAQAKLDRLYVEQSFGNLRTFNRSYPNKVNIFRLPYVLSQSHNRDAVLNLMLRDVSTTWRTDAEWHDYCMNLTHQHRQQYLNLLLK